MCDHFLVLVLYSFVCSFCLPSVFFCLYVRRLLYWPAGWDLVPNTVVYSCMWVCVRSHFDLVYLFITVISVEFTASSLAVMARLR